MAALGCYAAFGSTINSQFTIPGSSSQNALDQLQKTLPPAAGTRAQIVFESQAGTRITDSKYHSAGEATLDKAKHAPQVAAVVDPFTSRAISRDGRSALATVEYTVTRGATAPTLRASFIRRRWDSPVSPASWLSPDGHKSRIAGISTPRL